MSSKSQSLKDNLREINSALMALQLKQTPARITLNPHTPPPDINVPPLSMPAASSPYVRLSEDRTITIQKRKSPPTHQKP